MDHVRETQRAFRGFCATLLVFLTIFCPSAPAQTEATQPSQPAQAAPQSEKPARPMLQGGVTYCVPSGTPLKLKLSSIPTTGMHLMDKDFDGNYLPAYLGQKITAKTSEDLYVDNNKVIPEGTVFYGHISKVHAPRRVYRAGYVSVEFDHLTTPDGKTYAFKIDANNFKPSTWKSKAKGLGIIAAHTVGGAIVGALVAYQIFGWENTVSMHGYNIAGGAAGGALLATGYAILRKGHVATLEPGDDLNLETSADLLMPATREPTPKKKLAALEGLDIQVEKTKLKRDGLYGHWLTVKMLVVNNTNHYIESSDLCVQDTNGNIEHIGTGGDFDADMTFTIEPQSMKHVTACFQVEYPRLKHKLVVLNHHSRKICWKMDL